MSTSWRARNVSLFLRTGSSDGMKQMARRQASLYRMSDRPINTDTGVGNAPGRLCGGASEAGGKAAPCREGNGYQDMARSHASREGRGCGGVDALGVVDRRRLPDRELRALWDAIILDGDTKERLLSQAVLNFTLRPRVDRARVPLHGVILLVGAPGTGKTSLARGLATMTAESLSDNNFHYLEVDPHALMSAALGRSQKAVTELLGTTIADYAAIGPLIVLLDEVETLAAARSKLSLEANPVDVHRATDAVLVQLDRLAADHPRLLFLATSNFPEAVDDAFWSRADLVVSLETPGPGACRKILIDAIQALAAAYPRLAHLTDDVGLERAVSACAGLDGRAIRKLVVSACALDKHTALHPDAITVDHLVRAAQDARRVAGLHEGGAQ